MPRGSEALTQARREEIINACAQLYETMGFKDVTIKEIGKITSFTRTSIYNYFQTKEEIFLALIGREFDLWERCAGAALAEEQTLDRARLAEILADTLSARTLMLKILSMNMFEIEENSSVEQLTAFKRTFAVRLRASTRFWRKLRQSSTLLRAARLRIRSSRSCTAFIRTPP